VSVEYGFEIFCFLKNKVQKTLESKKFLDSRFTFITKWRGKATDVEVGKVGHIFFS